MKNIEIDLSEAKKLHLSGKIKEAQKIYLKLIETEKKNNVIFFLLGTTYLQQKNFAEAIKNLKISINLYPNYPNPYNNLGIAYAETSNFLDAKINYDKAIKLNKNYTDAYLNRGISLNKLKRYDEAISDLKLVLKIEPLNAKAFNSLGNVFKSAKQYDKAVENYEKAISIQPNYLEAISNKSSIYLEQKKYEESLICLNKIYQKDPSFKGTIENIIFNKMHIFEWSDLNKYKQEIKKQFFNNENIFDPLFIHYLFDEPKMHRINAEKFSHEKFKYLKKQKPKKIKSKNKKIKIGYFSVDYHNHPVLHIMKNIFKSHNNKNFELYGFSFGPEKEDNVWRDDIKKYFKKFFLLNSFSDEEIINLANKQKIDIAIDLSGLTKNARPGLFYKGVAPIQIIYLGYPGTSGNKEMDYIIADKTVIPEKTKKFYTEKVLYLPNCYISNSNHVLLDDKNNYLKRKDVSLPENQIVFCAFHNPLKINPELFNSWCNILKAVKKSVIWIKAIEDSSKKNLIYEFKSRKIDQTRVIFADRVENINEHINRLKLADIFLDTYPYNSHSTVYDYIKADLPMVIMKGETFSSRVGASIYKSIEMNELISHNYKEYEKIAIELGNNNLKLNKVREKLKFNSQKFKIFESKEITRNLEKIFSRVYNQN